jgi:hypothetical protein
MVYSECLPTRLNPLAERTCFSPGDQPLRLRQGAQLVKGQWLNSVDLR